MKHRTLWVVATAALCGCPRATVQRSGPEPSSVPVGSAADFASTFIGDRERDLRATNPWDRSWSHVTTLRNVALSLERRNGALPSTLGEIVAAARPMELAADAWGTEIRYTLSGDDFELRSAGPDRRFASADDIIATRRTQTPMRAGAFGP